MTSAAITRAFEDCLRLRELSDHQTLKQADNRDLAAIADRLHALAVSRTDTRYKGDAVPSLPWTWTGGYPQRITGPDATLIAECFENPDVAAVIAPLICDAVNAYFRVVEDFDAKP